MLDPPLPSEAERRTIRVGATKLLEFKNLCQRPNMAQKRQEMKRGKGIVQAIFVSKFYKFPNICITKYGIF